MMTPQECRNMREQKLCTDCVYFSVHEKLIRWVEIFPVLSLEHEILFSYSKRTLKLRISVKLVLKCI